MNFWNWIVNKVISKVQHFWTFYFAPDWTIFLLIDCLGWKLKHVCSRATHWFSYFRFHINFCTFLLVMQRTCLTVPSWTLLFSCWADTRGIFTRSRHGSDVWLELLNLFLFGGTFKCKGTYKYDVITFRDIFTPPPPPLSYCIIIWHTSGWCSSDDVILEQALRTRSYPVCCGFLFGKQTCKPYCLPC